MSTISELPQFKGRENDDENRLLREMAAYLAQAFLGDWAIGPSDRDFFSQMTKEVTSLDPKNTDPKISAMLCTMLIRMQDQYATIEALTEHHADITQQILDLRTDLRRSGSSSSIIS
jgi:hypothetical protein